MFVPMRFALPFSHSFSSSREIQFFCEQYCFSRGEEDISSLQIESKKKRKKKKTKIADNLRKSQEYPDK
jgi:hypothetical protein